MNNRKVGFEGEQKALELLQKKGYKLIEKNFKCKIGEVDLIVERKKTLIFVEVKFRKNNKMGSPLEAVNMKKQRKIIKTSQFFLLLNNKYENYNKRFDVIGVTTNDMIHIEGAFYG
ncbi:MAG TPA: YraN family protein [Candidatus Mcinerneyibacterium sp.]|nr:YraN family protein [Candidatus Mcinerneyibacterium sp.]